MAAGEHEYFMDAPENSHPDLTDFRTYNCDGCSSEAFLTGTRLQQHAYIAMAR